MEKKCHACGGKPAGAGSSAMRIAVAMGAPTVHQRGLGLLALEELLSAARRAFAFAGSITRVICFSIPRRVSSTLRHPAWELLTSFLCLLAGWSRPVDPNLRWQW